MQRTKTASFGNKVKSKRKDKGLSQVQTAELLGVSKQSVCDWEKGRCFPKYQNLKQLATLFETTTDYLLQQETDNYNLT